MPSSVGFSYLNTLLLRSLIFSAIISTIFTDLIGSYLEIAHINVQDPIRHIP